MSSPLYTPMIVSLLWVLIIIIISIAVIACITIKNNDATHSLREWISYIITGGKN